jgi:hypothetical protein
MRKFLFFLPVILLFMAACNNEKANNGNVVKEDSTEKVITDQEKMQQATDEMDKKKEELSRLRPLSLDELKALIPVSLLGAERINHEATMAMGAGLATGEYKLSDTTTITLHIYDCAGSGGAGIYNMQYIGRMNMEKESEDEYTRTVDFNGGKAFEHCDKTSTDCTFTYLAGGRYLVTLEGDNVGADALKQAARALNIK